MSRLPNPLGPVSLALALGCSAGTGAAQDRQARDVLHVEYAGCKSVLVGPVCILPDDRLLTVWVGSSGGEATIEHGTERLGWSSGQVEGNGRRFRIAIADDADQITVRLRGSNIRETWSMPLAEETRPRYFLEAASLFRTGRMAEAQALLEESLTDPALPQRGNALGLLGRIHRKAGNIDDARTSLESAVADSAREGRRLDAIRHANVLAFLLMHDARDFTAARAVYADFPDGIDVSSETRYFRHYYLGLVGFNSGDARSALHHLAQARAQAFRMSGSQHAGDKARTSSQEERWQARALNASEILALQLQALGRRNEAMAALESWRERLPSSLGECARGRFLTNLGWNAILALEAGEPAPDPTSDLEQAASHFVACDLEDRINGDVNLALANLHAGRLDIAETHVARARSRGGSPTVGIVLWALDLDGRLALQRGLPRESLATYEQMQALADATISPDARWRAAIGRARAWRALGDSTQALAALDDAERETDRDLLFVAAYEGRDGLLAARQRAVSNQVEWLSELGRTSEALQVARRARSRLLTSMRTDFEALDAGSRAQLDAAVSAYRSLRERLAARALDSWTLPLDELSRQRQERKAGEEELRVLFDRALQASRPVVREADPRPASGEVVVLFHAASDGWLVFIETAQAVNSYRPDCAPPGDLASDELPCLVAPLGPYLRSAASLRILASGALQHYDLHAASVDDSALIATLPVTYGLDLPAANPGVRNPRAVLVADPTLSLADARAEVAEVSSILHSSGGWTIAEVQGELAVSSSVRHDLEGAGLFHFAGHARFGGDRGWDSELTLAHGTAIEVADILMLADPPDMVVLSGCETGVASSSAPTATLGLAHAFLVSGATSVVATSRPVASSTAREIMAKFYGSWAKGVPAHEALRLAQLDLYRADPASDWSAFRLIAR